MANEQRPRKQKLLKVLLWIGIALVILLVAFFIFTVVLSDSSDSDNVDDAHEETTEVEDILLRHSA